MSPEATIETQNFGDGIPSLPAVMLGMEGPEFLVCYGFWFLAVWVAVLVARHKGNDNLFVTLSGLVSFEAVGVIRYMIGSSQGMHKWGFMFLMMGVGALFFILRAENFKSGGDGSGGWFSCGGGGGCGGGGCGGGGCGGCGGS